MNIHELFQEFYADQHGLLASDISLLQMRNGSYATAAIATAFRAFKAGYEANKTGFTAVAMTTATADGFRDGVDSFKIRGEVLMEILHDGGPEPFVCAVHGCICLEQLEAAQTDFRENMPDELDRGEGIYTFSFYYDRGQYDEYGRCEIASGWGFDFVSYQEFELEPEVV